MLGRKNVDTASEARAGLNPCNPATIDSLLAPSTKYAVRHPTVEPTTAPHAGINPFSTKAFVLDCSFVFESAPPKHIAASTAAPPQGSP
mmetsp:Transcript_1066/g.1500  ORF Transcript_1066/g.1500 Transcript_1066/m.1500 type:complete len:89 (-) Transcript_1066:749-1015(-)